MGTLVWDQVGDRVFETGISKGVLYKDDGYGVPWNGLISVTEESNNEVEAVYFDGVKFDDIVTLGDFSGTLQAFTYPEEFLPYEGTQEDQTGFYILNQPPGKFGLSYQTTVGNDVDGLEAGYKIHLHYNLTAVASSKTFDSISDELDPIEFEWEITAVPEDVEYFYPTAHVILDSRRLDKNLLQDIEEILYGTDQKDAFLPSLKSLSSYIRKWNRLLIIDNGDGTWTAESRADNIITMLDETTFEITADSAEFIDATSYTISSSNKNEEDLWQR